MGEISFILSKSRVFLTCLGGSIKNGCSIPVLGIVAPTSFRFCSDLFSLAWAFAMNAETPLCTIYSALLSSLLLSFFNFNGPSLKADLRMLGLSSLNFFLRPGKTPFVVAENAPLYAGFSFKTVLPVTGFSIC